MMNIQDKRIVVTGASGGIGRELVQRLSADGARLLLVGRQQVPLDVLAAQAPERVNTLCADLNTVEGRDAVLAAARAWGGLDGLVLCAGVGGFGLLDEQDDATLAALIDTNVTTVLQLTRRLLPLLREADEAVILNVGSTLGSIGHPGFVAYCASKFALRGMSEALRRELADTRIRVLYVAPRATQTPMNPARLVAMNRDLDVAMDPPERVAAAVYAALRCGRDETYIGWPERLFVWLNGLLPRCVDQALRRRLPTILRFARDPATVRTPL
jgi:short-subunit dehydrogenase